VNATAFGWPSLSVRKVTARFVKVMTITSFEGWAAHKDASSTGSGRFRHVEEDRPHRCAALRTGRWNSGRSPRTACRGQRILRWRRLLTRQTYSGAPRGPSADLVTGTLNWGGRLERLPHWPWLFPPDCQR
jgi:hypothetical protein